MPQLVNTKRISISNFTFELLETNQYLVKFYSTKNNKEYMNIINDIDLIIACKVTTNPKQKDLIKLKRLCKSWKLKN